MAYFKRAEFWHRTGTCVPPTVRVGKTLLVGFDENSYADVLR